MIARRSILAAMAAFALKGQAPQSPAAQNQDSQSPPPSAITEAPDAKIVTTVNVVVVPVSVIDRDGNIVNGLQPADFHLFDNGKEQDIRVDVAFQPISMVIAIEASDRAEAILTQIRKIGSLIEPLVIGEQGEAAVLAFDHRLQELQGFTNDSTKITDAIKKIHAGSTSSRMIDAVDRAVFMLRNKPVNRRRIVLLISETRDKSSEGKLKNALIDAQLANVTVYTVNISQLARRLTEKPQPPRPDPQPTTAYTLPGGRPATPTSVQQKTGLGNRVEFLPLLKEVYTDAKGIFVDNPAEVFTKGTGGTEFSFYKQHGLEEAIQRISEDIHSQYMLSYPPNNKDEAGFHEITVDITRRADLKTRTRPGYWIASIR